MTSVISSFLLTWTEVLTQFHLFCEFFNPGKTQAAINYRNVAALRRSALQCPATPRLRPMRGPVDEVPSLRLPSAVLDGCELAEDESTALDLDD